MRDQLRTNPTARRLNDVVRRREVLSLTAKFENVEIPYPDLFIGTHHKTGTAWLQAVFVRFAQISHCTFHNIRSGQLDDRDRPRRILFDYHCAFEDYNLKNGRGFRMVRDPRDVLISAMHYHRRGSEAWMHRERSDGRTYVETINTLSDEDALLFEIDENTGKTIREMTSFNGGDAVKTVHYEDYIDDSNMENWFSLLLGSGLRSVDLILAQQALYEKSLFGMKQKGGHIRSGAKQQWRGKLSDKVLARFQDRFPHAVEILGYEE